MNTTRIGFIYATLSYKDMARITGETPGVFKTAARALGIRPKLMNGDRTHYFTDADFELMAIHMQISLPK